MSSLVLRGGLGFFKDDGKLDVIDNEIPVLIPPRGEPKAERSRKGRLEALRKEREAAAGVRGNGES